MSLSVKSTGVGLSDVLKCLCVSGGAAGRDGGLSVRPGRPDRQRFAALQEED